METNVLSYLLNAANLYPNKIAFACRDSAITYAELLERARGLACSIKHSGMQNSAVGVLCGRDINTPVYFMAVLLSGNFYVPIDPDMPQEKRMFIIQDTEMRILLGNDEYKNAIVDKGYHGTFLTVSNIESGDLSIPDADKETPCYMVYTSGSTGKPKGVLKSHGAVISFIEAYINSFDFSSDDIIGNQTPFFFDASAKDIYLSFRIGATVEILPTELFAMPPMLIEYMNQKKITFISWVPTALSMVAQTRTLSFVLPQTLKKVFFVGEVMPMKHLNYWRKYLPNLQYVNLYGQSELAGICCFYEIKDAFNDADVLPMGKPMANCNIYLIDNGEIVTEPEHMGEMYIISDALALEYYNDEEKTRNSFLYKDFGEGTVRCFKTGDLAKRDCNGNYIFASRNDFQIKHMGRRIELGEIEAVAGALDEIARCACLYDSKKSKIILFVELSQGAIKTEQEIQSMLRPLLSSYMVPGKVHIIETMPLNANGKINRKQLAQCISQTSK